jgi:hypothetical protein
VNSMRRHRPALFRGRHFPDHVIVLCVRWYLRYCLTLRDLEELIGWSMIARVWRSLSNLAITCSLSIPGLMIFSATSRLIGCN